MRIRRRSDCAPHTTRPEPVEPLMNVETVHIDGIAAPVSRIGLGTWAIGGWMWGGADDAASILTIRGAIEKGINLIDTAPAYGFGRSQEIVGRALDEGGVRRQVKIATKAGLRSEE